MAVREAKVEMEKRADEETVDARPYEFESFYKQRAEGVYRALALTLGNADLAQEAAAEALTRAFQHWRKVRDYQNPAGWTYRVGLNWATSRLRRRRRESSQQVDPPIDKAEVVDLDLYQAIQDLSLLHREVIVMHYLLDLRQSDIAQVLNVAEGTVKSRLSRGLAQLREVLSS